MTGPLAPNSRYDVAVERFGNEAQPLVTVDDCLAEPDELVRLAGAQRFAPIGPYYPGVRLPIRAEQAMPLVDPVIDQITEIFALPRPPAFLECYLSLVTKAPASLMPIQRLPHFDGLESERLAVLLYLDRQQRGGTAFYRQRETGYESVDEARFATYRRVLEDGVQRHGMPPAEYIGDDNPLFERTLAVEDRYNRMIVYRGNTLHCAALPPDFVPDPNPATGRLSLNLFLSGADANG